MGNLKHAFALIVACTFWYFAGKTGFVVDNARPVLLFVAVAILLLFFGRRGVAWAIFFFLFGGSYSAGMAAAHEPLMGIAFACSLMTMFCICLVSRLTNIDFKDL